MKNRVTPRRKLDHIEVKRLRNSAGMTQAAFAEALGVSCRTVEDWECAHRNEPPYYLILAVQSLTAPDYEARVKEIGDFAHDRSTGPAVPDDLWEIRRMAYGL